MTGFVRFISSVLTTALMAMVVLGGAVFYLNYQYDAEGPLTSSREVTVRSGEGRLEIAEKLEGSGVITSRQMFILNHFARNFVRWFNGEPWHDLKAGEYAFEAGASMRTVRAVHWEDAPIVDEYDARPHRIELDMAPDNRGLPQNLPLAPWC